ncbi:YceI family protein [Myxococcota bacterium]|nr:YceI family protein [Myxococcota bacterium]MBU1430033.1 YceI family protein [Myxococcota bacterium]MBU1899430.1 YceI family protein [Myxococcota bacterium]
MSEPRFHIFTFKDGLLSSVAHDLRFSLKRFELSRDGAQVTGRFWPDSLIGDGVMRDGALHADGLSDKDWKDIDKNIRQKILDTAKHPEILFEGKINGGRVEGTLTMKGRRAPVRFDGRVEAGVLSAQVEIKPSDWGIPPFKALLGAIKLKDRVLIDFELPL